MKRAIKKIITQYWLRLLVITSIAFVVAGLTLLLWINTPADKYGDNILIEFVIGGLFVFVPLTVGIVLGKKINEQAFYSDIIQVLRKIALEQRNGNLLKPSARALVKEISDTFGKDTLTDPLFKVPSNVPISLVTRECGVCGLEAETLNNHCRNCKLNCFAWESKLHLQ